MSSSDSDTEYTLDSDEPGSILSSAISILDDRGGLKGLLTALLGGTFVAVTVQAWDFIASLGSTFMKPLRALGSGLATLITGTFGGPVIITDAGAQTAAQSITDGLVSYLGVLAFPVAVATSMAGIYVFAWFWSRMSLSPLGWLKNLRG